jgi:glycosyltransferase involved in cell wall biosynthesis
VGYVPPEERRSLYDGAYVLVQPSYEEGFGLPVLEAMTLGVPVVAANRGALPEVLGDAGILVRSNDPMEMAAELSRLVTDTALAESLAAKGVARSRMFRWEDTAERVYAVYEEAIRRHTHKRASA